MSVSVKALVQIDLDGTTYEPGSWITLPDSQGARAQELLAYGLVEEAPAKPVRPKRRRAS
ncbi:hypothetical protein OG497_37650 [Streptomyces sp. NBC_01242]|uniref:hypothetical protein n=1 Tax=Streptomyces sp. NBC_01242 TaxID=2903795 RepID=UPI00224E409E|nr:hypothetical protein [Streptomyces sp. NBC_01242]MCX4799583.1 hypothetical protein [Streptomyces sp. NBC_01242]